MMISNGDFNPRNIIRLSDGRLVLIDWNGIVFPLEHHLTYPWLLNWKNPAWRTFYAAEFEKRLESKQLLVRQNTRMHSMDIALRQALKAQAKKQEEIVTDHMEAFRASIQGFESLTEVCQ